MEVRQWVENAIEFAGTTQTKLAEELTRLLQRSIDRAAVNKMVKGTRNVSGEELIAIERITGYPSPLDMENLSRAELIEWAKLLRELDPTQRQQSFSLLQGLVKPPKN